MQKLDSFFVSFFYKVHKKRYLMVFICTWTVETKRKLQTVRYFSVKTSTRQLTSLFLFWSSWILGKPQITFPHFNTRHVVFVGLSLLLCPLPPRQWYHQHYIITVAYTQFLILFNTKSSHIKWYQIFLQNKSMIYITIQITTKI